MSEIHEYECSICGQIVEARGTLLSEHYQHHRAQSDWPGYMSWLLVTKVPDEVPDE